MERFLQISAKYIYYKYIYVIFEPIELSLVYSILNPSDSNIDKYKTMTKRIMRIFQNLTYFSAQLWIFFYHSLSINQNTYVNQMVFKGLDIRMD
jgi:hypothetical protein